VGLGREAGVAPGGGAGPGGRESISGQAALAQARLQTALAYLDAYYAGESLKLTTLTEHHVHEESEAAKARLASSTGSSQEVLQMTAARGLAQDESADAQQLQAAALVALQRWVGLHPDSLSAPALPALPAEQSTTSMPPRAGSPSLTRTSRT
jgi:outer membrane protein TolC